MSRPVALIYAPTRRLQEFPPRLVLTGAWYCLDRGSLPGGCDRRSRASQLHFAEDWQSCAPAPESACPGDVLLREAPATPLPVSLGSSVLMSLPREPVLPGLSLSLVRGPQTSPSVLGLSFLRRMVSPDEKTLLFLRYSNGTIESFLDALCVLFGKPFSTQKS